jgi:hypothetical protein
MDKNQCQSSLIWAEGNIRKTNDVQENVIKDITLHKWGL